MAFQRSSRSFFLQYGCECPGGRPLEYVPLALLMAPLIHVAFSLFAGWHDYMPFPVYIPSLAELLRRGGQ